MRYEDAAEMVECISQGLSEAAKGPLCCSLARS